MAGAHGRLIQGWSGDFAGRNDHDGSIRMTSAREMCLQGNCIH